MNPPRTLLDKIWDLHAIASASEGEEVLLYVDRSFVHEESGWTFDRLRRDGDRVLAPGQTVAFADHYAPTSGRERGLSGVADRDAREMLKRLQDNASEQHLRHVGIDDPLQGIMHVVGPERGWVLPGFVLVGSDSHTTTSGAFGAFAFGIGQTELRQVFLTQTVWRRKPRQLRILLEGVAAPGVSAKDVVLRAIAEVEPGQAAGHVVEFAGDAVSAMSMEQRMTLCNMSVEMGAQTGLIAPDDVTLAFLEGAPAAPKGEHFRNAARAWRALAGDPGATFDRDVSIRVASLEPMVTWGTSLQDVASVGSRVPNPEDQGDPSRRARAAAALDYMGLVPGTPLVEIGIDLAFIGSCTNGRIEDLRAAAAIFRGRRAAVPTFVSPGSRSVKRQAEQEGLDRVFADANVAWLDSGCSMCVGSNGDTVPAGKRCAASSARNFVGRQGVGARTHVMSPAMVAAASVAGRIADVRALAGGRA